MDRKLFKIPFTKTNIPHWGCPTCGRGTLELVDESFRTEERATSKELRKTDYWEVEWLAYAYQCLLQCGNKHCNEFVMSCGVGTIEEEHEEDFEGNYEQVYVEYYSPKFFLPSLNLIPIPDGTPDKVKGEISKSFGLFFCNPAAAANHLRIGIEHLLTSLKIRQFVTKSNKRRFLNLHQRIDLVPAKQTKLKELFFAIKWLGNAGSHSSKEISADDVMDAYEIFDVLLRELYDSSGKLAKKLAKQINLKKGPIRRGR